VAKPELGTKRVDPETGKKFYDLNKDPIISPFTGIAYPRSAFETRQPERGKAEAVRAREPEAEAEEEEIGDVAAVEADLEVISLEEAEDATPDDVIADGDDDEAVIPEADALEIEPDIEPEDDAAFLEQEEEGDPVTDLLDVEGEEEDEV
jgi:uncharacterized protein (TIGR02300 family)